VGPRAAARIGAVDVLMLTNVLPGGRRTGGEIVTQSVVDALFKAGREVRTLGYRRPGDGARPQRGELCVGRRPAETRAAGPRALAWGARALATRTPYSTTKWRSRAYLRAVDEALGEGPGAVIVDHAGLHVVAPPADRSGARSVFLAHNAEGEMYARLAAAAGTRAGRSVYAREARLIREVETQLATRSRQVWTLTESDADYFRAISPAADVRTLEVASPLCEPVDAAGPEYDVALIGTWNWRANAHGLEWFADEVVPRLPAGMTVEVAGRGADWLQGRHPNVAVRGVVPDAQRFMSKARVMAVPSVEGGGVQVKTLDAIASGVPVVATRVATRGLHGLPASVAVAEGAADFAENLRSLAAEPGRDALRAEAVAWSRARRERLDANVASWVGELTGGEPEPRQPAREPVR
jgi:hypothetical protein